MGQVTAEVVARVSGAFIMIRGVGTIICRLRDTGELRFVKFPNLIDLGEQVIHFKGKSRPNDNFGVPSPRLTSFGALKMGSH